MCTPVKTTSTTRAADQAARSGHKPGTVARNTKGRLVVSVLAREDLGKATATTPVNGHDFLELARARQKYTLDAARVLGLAEDSLVYLGYPDSGLAQMPMAAGDTTYRSPLTRKNCTYGPAFPDYHSQMHQNPVALPADCGAG